MVDAIAGIMPVSSMSLPKAAATEDASFMQVLRELDSTLRQAETQSVNLALEKTDNLQQVMTDITRAQISMQFAVEVRNRALEAYQELMRMSL